jgi:hypothetical protein
MEIKESFEQDINAQQKKVSELSSQLNSTRRNLKKERASLNTKIRAMNIYLGIKTKKTKKEVVKNAN